MKFRKKPVVIEAVQFKADNLDELNAFAGNYFEYHGMNEDGFLIGSVKTLEDGSGNYKVKHIATQGDWIIKGVQGEFYPCKPDIFEQTYERAE